MFSAPAISLTGLLIETSGRNVATLWYFVATARLGLLLVFVFVFVVVAACFLEMICNSLVFLAK